ncbi:MAG: leucine-rich repeat domain-containing protein [Oscillospiraceae bacterium]|nr:leucine-rich repeat domain-containing protein [Oscillospiraceae bacterium]
MKKLLLAVLIAAMCLSAVSVPALAWDEAHITHVIRMGMVGDEVYWSLTTDFVLRIEGPGAMPTGYYCADQYRWFYTSDFTESAVIAEGITNIGPYAFAEWYTLERIVIPKSVTSIGKLAFYKCTGLKDVYYAGSEEDWAAVAVGERNHGLDSAVIHFNCSGTEIGTLKNPKSTGFGYPEGPIWEFSNGVLTVSGNGSDYGKPNGMTYFFRTDGNQYEEIEDEVETIVVEEGITAITEYLFSGTSNASEVYLPASLESIGKYAFYNNGVTDVYFAGSREEWQAVSILDGNDALKNAEIHFGYSYDPRCEEGVLGGIRWNWQAATGQLSAFGSFGSGRVYAAVYDSDGRMCSASAIKHSGESVYIGRDFDLVRLFCLGEDGSPICRPSDIIP